MSKDGFQRGILKFPPDLKLTPPLKVECPRGLDKVSKRLCSEEERINNVDNLIDLHKLRDFVFADRLDTFHWDISPYSHDIAREASNDTDAVVDTEIAMKSDYPCDDNSENDGVYGDSDKDYSSDISDDDDSSVNEDESDDVDGNGGDNSGNKRASRGTKVRNRRQAGARKATINGKSAKRRKEPNNKLDYAVNSFVVVNSGEGKSESKDTLKFLVGKVVSVERPPNSKYVSRLKVHWYDCDDKTNVDLDAKYSPFYGEAVTKRAKVTTSSAKPSRKKLKVPICDSIDTDCVLVSFDSLTKHRKLPVSVQKKLTR